VAPQTSLSDIPPFTGHSPEQERPLGAYLVLMGTFTAACGAFAAWVRATGRTLPERVEPGDIVLVAVATHKLSRLVTKDRVTSSLRAPFTRFQDDAGPGEVEEAARGHGLRRAIGELVICPYCIGLWIAAAFVCGLVAAPRTTRLVAAAFTALTGSDALQIAYKKAEDSL
jgi:Protein of unknown function (DUF1360)